MKSAAAIVAELAARDIKLHVEDGKLRVNAPRGAVTPELRDLLAARKEDLIALLAEEKAAASAGATIPRLPRTAPLPMSFGQQRMWFITRMAPGRALFNLPLLYRIDGPLDTAAMQRALAEIVKRHEVLRTTLRMEGEATLQSILPEFHPCPAVEDATREAGARDEVVTRLVSAELARPFDLERVPPFRARLIRLGADDHLLLLVLHHSAGDGWSLGILQRELVALYTAFAAGQPSPLPELPVQYADFAAWQRATLDASATARGLAYWRTQLAGLEPALELPTDHPRPAVQTTSGAMAFKALSADVFQQLRRLGTQHRVTRFMALLAVWAIVLARYTGRSDLAIGTPVTNRGRRELEDLIGFFVNSLVLRLNVDPGATFADLLAHARQVTLDAYAHQDLPFEQLVEELRPPRDLSRHPLFQVEFVLHAESRGAMTLPNLSVRPALPSSSRGVALDLSLEITDDDRHPAAVLLYSTDLFDATTAERLIAYYELLLGVVAADPAVQLSQLPAMLPEDEARLSEWNATGRPLPAARTLHALFEAQARRTPDRVAVIAGDDRLTYAELEARANAYADRLQRHGFRPGSLAGVYMERTAELLPALLGIHKAGGAYLPLDPAFPRDRIAYMLEDSGAAVLIVDEASRPTAPAFAGTVLSADAPDVDRITALAAHRVPSDGESLAYVIYTSGSTGRPKGVQIPHRALVNFLESMRERPGLSPDDRLVAVTTLSFDIAGLELFLPITSGATVVLARREAAADPARLMALMTACDATVMQATPATWRMLIEAGWTGSPRLRVFCGGEAMPHDIGRALVERTAEVWNLYGPTETTIWSTIDRVGADGVATIGTPIANTRIYVLDASLRPVPIGAAGEIFIGGAGVARGYLNRPELTAERFVPDPDGFDADARMYRTGDLGRYRADGRLQYLGRADHQVKLRGFRIELGEIESVLAAHPAVAQAVAQVREDSPGDPRLVAYIVPGAGGDPTAELKQAAIEKLPQYMRPTAYVLLEALPLTPNGKVDRRALPAPDRDSSRAFVAPRNPIEEVIAETWQAVFKREQVGVEDDFFELGGHSLMAIQVLSRVREQFDVDVPLVTLFESPTVAGLAMAVMERLLAAEDATPA